MSEDKIKKTEQSQPISQPKEGEIIKGQINERLYSEQPATEGYQPTDKLDTSNPPTDRGEDKTE